MLLPTNCLLSPQNLCVAVRLLLLLLLLLLLTRESAAALVLSESREAMASSQQEYDDSDDEAYLQAIGDYKPGSITKIELENFMTHAKVEMKPGPR